jgi:translocation and assembly module TamA
MVQIQRLLTRRHTLIRPHATRIASMGSRKTGLRLLASTACLAALASHALAQTAATAPATTAPPAVNAPDPSAQVTHTLPAKPPVEAPVTPDAPTKPIISDADFDAALPAVDESPPALPAPVPATLPLDVANALTPTAADLPAVAASDDAEMTAPLAPLDTVDVQPVQTATAPAEASPQIAYSTQVDGLKTIGELNTFKSLSALYAGKGKAANAAMVRARANDDQALALRLMKSQGYYDGTVGAAITVPTDGPNPNQGQVQARLTAQPGKPYKLGLIQIDAQPTTPPNLIRDALPLKTGDIIVADQVIAAEANVSLVLPQKGYPFAKVESRDVALDPDTNIGDYTLKVDTGDRSRFGTITTTGDKPAFDANHIQVLSRFKSGDLYDSRNVDDLRQALIATGLFRTVAVEPVATGQKDNDGLEIVDLNVTQQAGPARTLAFDAGYSTGEGFTADATWTNRNLWPPEGALILNGKLGTQEQGVGATFRRSNDGRRDRTTSLSLSADHNVYASYQAYTFGFSGSVSRVSTPIWQKLWTWSYGSDLLVTRESTTDPTTGANVFSTYYLLNVPLKVEYDRTDDLLNPVKGFRLAASGGPQISLQDGGSNLRVVLDGSYYYPLGARMVLASRIRLGSLLGAPLNDIAPSRRLYAGGGGSVRGFAYQGLGPLDVKGDPTGGRSLFESSFELRYRFGDYGIVPFIDMGQVYDKTVPDFSDVRIGVGVGARLYTNFGPIRIDISTPVDRRPTEPQVTLYVGIGQAF